MAVAIKLISQGNALEISITGKLDKEAYEVFVPELERLIEKNGKVRILVEMHDFHGWDAAALWEDIKFDTKYFRDFEKIAMLGETKWEKGMSAFCKPFTTGKVKYFEKDKKAEALAWLADD